MNTGGPLPKPRPPRLSVGQHRSAVLPPGSGCTPHLPRGPLVGLRVLPAQRQQLLHLEDVPGARIGEGLERDLAEPRDVLVERLGDLEGAERGRRGGARSPRRRWIADHGGTAPGRNEGEIPRSSSPLAGRDPVLVGHPGGDSWTACAPCPHHCGDVPGNPGDPETQTRTEPHPRPPSPTSSVASTRSCLPRKRSPSARQRYFANLSLIHI